MVIGGDSSNLNIDVVVNLAKAIKSTDEFAKNLERKLSSLSINIPNISLKFDKTQITQISEQIRKQLGTVQLRYNTEVAKQQIGSLVAMANKDFSKIKLGFDKDAAKAQLKDFFKETYAKYGNLRQTKDVGSEKMLMGMYRDAMTLSGANIASTKNELDKLTLRYGAGSAQVKAFAEEQMKLNAIATTQKTAMSALRTAFDAQLISQTKYDIGLKKIANQTENFKNVLTKVSKQTTKESYNVPTQKPENYVKQFTEAKTLMSQMAMSGSHALNGLIGKFGLASNEVNKFTSEQWKGSAIAKQYGHTIGYLQQALRSGQISQENFSGKVLQSKNILKNFGNKLNFTTPAANVQKNLGMMSTILDNVNLRLSSALTNFAGLSNIWASIRLPHLDINPLMNFLGLPADTFSNTSKGLFGISTAAWATAGALTALGSGIAGTLTAINAIKAGTQFEDLENQMMALVHSSTKFKDTTTGEFVDMNKNLELSLAHSKTIIQQFIKDAPQLAGVTLEELSYTASVTLGRLANHGIVEAEEQAKIIESLAVATKVVTRGQQNVAGQLAQEARALIEGKDFRVQNTLMNTLAANFGSQDAFKEAIKKAKAEGNYGEFLLEQLKPFIAASEYASNSLKNHYEIWSDFMTRFNTTIASSAGMFEQYKDMVKGFLSSFVQMKRVDPKKVLEDINKALSTGKIEGKQIGGKDRNEVKRKYQELAKIRDKIMKDPKAKMDSTELGYLGNLGFKIEGIDFGQVLPEMISLAEKISGILKETFVILTPLSKTFGQFSLAIYKFFISLLPVLNVVLSIFTVVIDVVLKGLTILFEFGAKLLDVFRPISSILLGLGNVILNAITHLSPFNSIMTMMKDNTLLFNNIITVLGISFGSFLGTLIIASGIQAGWNGLIFITNGILGLSNIQIVAGNSLLQARNILMGISVGIQTAFNAVLGIGASIQALFTGALALSNLHLIARNTLAAIAIGIQTAWNTILITAASINMAWAGIIASGNMILIIRNTLAAIAIGFQTAWNAVMAAGTVIFTLQNAILLVYNARMVIGKAITLGFAGVLTIVNLLMSNFVIGIAAVVGIGVGLWTLFSNLGKGTKDWGTGLQKVGLIFTGMMSDWKLGFGLISTYIDILSLKIMKLIDTMKRMVSFGMLGDDYYSRKLSYNEKVEISRPYNAQISDQTKIATKNSWFGGNQEKRKAALEKIKELEKQRKEAIKKAETQGTGYSDDLGKTEEELKNKTNQLYELGKKIQEEQDKYKAEGSGDPKPDKEAEAAKEAIDKARNREIEINKQYNEDIRDIEREGFKLASQQLEVKRDLLYTEAGRNRQLIEISQKENDLAQQSERINLLQKAGQLTAREAIKENHKIKLQELQLQYDKEVIALQKTKEDNEQKIIDIDNNIVNAKQEIAKHEAEITKQKDIQASQQKLLNNPALKDTERTQASEKLVTAIDAEAKAKNEILKITTKISDLEKDRNATQDTNIDITTTKSEQAKKDLEAKIKQEEERTKANLMEQRENIKESMMEGGKGFIKDLVQSFREGGTTLGQAFVNALTNYGNKVFDAFLDNMVKGIFADRGTNSGTGAGAFGGIVSLFSGHAKKPENILGDNILQTDQLGTWGIYNKTGELVKGLGTNCKSAADEMVGLKTKTGGVIGVFINLISTIGDGLSKAFNGISDWFSKLGSGGSANKCGAMGNIGGKGGGFSGIGDFFSNIGGKISGLFGGSSGGGGIGGALSSITGGIGGALSGVGGALSGVMNVAGPILGVLGAVGGVVMGFLKSRSEKKRKEAIEKAKTHIDMVLQGIDTFIKQIDKDLKLFSIKIEKGIKIAERQIGKLNLDQSIWDLQKAINKTIGTPEQVINEELVKKLQDQQNELRKQLSNNLQNAPQSISLAGGFGGLTSLFQRIGGITNNTNQAIQNQIDVLQKQIDDAMKGELNPTGIIDSLMAQRDKTEEARKAQIAKMRAEAQGLHQLAVGTNWYKGGKEYAEAAGSLAQRATELEDQLQDELRDLDEKIEDYQEKIKDYIESQKKLIIHYTNQVDKEKAMEIFGDEVGGIYDEVASFSESVRNLLSSGFDPDKVAYLIERQAIRLNKDLEQKVKDLYNDFAEKLIALQDELHGVLTEGRATGRIQQTQQDKVADIRRRIDELYAEQQNVANSELGQFGLNLTDANKALEYFSDIINNQYQQALLDAKNNMTLLDKIEVRVFTPEEVARVVEEKLRMNASVPSYLRGAL